MVYMTTVAPMGAKRGSTAPYTRASMLLVEVGNACPASMAEAFDKPVEAEDVGMHLSACKALATYIKDRDANYPQYVNRYFAMALGGDTNPLWSAVGQTGSMSTDKVVQAATAALKG